MISETMISGFNFDASVYLIISSIARNKEINTRDA